MKPAQVLIVGAGPTGLMLALRLVRHGIGVRIVDRAAGPGTASRAMAVHARTLEFYRQLGLADAIVRSGIPIKLIHLREHGQEVGRLPLKDIGAGLSPYPFVLAYPQDEHERFLVAHLQELGVEVDWNTQLLDFAQDEQCLHAHLGQHTFALMLPVRASGMQRLIGIMPAAAADKTDPCFEDIRPMVEQLLGIGVEAVHWFSTYRAHHRVATEFQSGRCFLLGDAAHVHSPAGGQGMNTGLGDAVNLSWKLAHVLQQRAAPDLLDSYEAERIVFARKLVATTDRAFKAVVSQGLGGHLLRHWLLPDLFPYLTGFPAARRAVFKTLSQVQINYQDSRLSGGRAGDILGGDRLPWVHQPEGDNFAPLQSLDWQLHLYGEPAPALALAAEADRLGLPCHVFAWSDAAAQAGLLRDAAYLVRPDGYVALALPRQQPGALSEYAAHHGLRLGASASAPGLSRASIEAIKKFAPPGEKCDNDIHY